MVNGLKSKKQLYDKDYFMRTHKRATSSIPFGEWDEIIKLIKNKNKRLKILDVGCGTGVAIRYLSEKTNWDINGIDFSEETKKYWKELKCNIGDACNLKFKDNSFDVIFSSHTLAHFYSPNEFIKEASRVLKPGGKLIIITPNKYYIWLMKPLNILRIIKYEPDPTVLHYFSLKSLKKLLYKNKFIIEDAYHYGEIANLVRKLKFVNRFKSRLIVCATKRCKNGIIRGR